MSFESRYGMCVTERALAGSPRAEMTLPSACRPELMDMASLARSPTAAVRLSRSEPARSTKCILDTASRTSLSSRSSPSRSGEKGVGVVRPLPMTLAGRWLKRLPLGVEGRPPGVGLETRDDGRLLSDARCCGNRLAGDGGGAIAGLSSPRRWTSVSEKMACDRDDCAFMSVPAVCRTREPIASAAITSAADRTLSSRRPDQMIVPSLASRIDSAGRSPSGMSGSTSRSIRSSLYSST